jgi:hypothetical protein
MAAVGLLVVFACKVSFLRSTAEGRIARQVTNWYLADPSLRQQHPHVVASHPAMYVDLDRPPGEWNAMSLRTPSPGVIVIWDPKCGPYNADSRLVSTVAGLKAIGWRPIKTFAGGWVAMVERDSSRQP